jgi:hypothetical protein
VTFGFSTLEIRTICESQVRAEREFGPDTAKDLRSRLADIVAAEVISDLVAGDPAMLQDSRGSFVAIHLHDGYRLILLPNQSHVPKHADGSVNWTKIRRVKIDQVEKVES